MSKHDARDWREERRRIERIAVDRQEQIDLLEYMANKRKSGYPSVLALRDVGLNAAADKLAQAYALIDEAHTLALAERPAEPDIPSP